jgi:hypothetical protein
MNGEPRLLWWIVWAYPHKWACNHKIWSSIYNAESESFVHGMTQIRKLMEPTN